MRAVHHVIRSRVEGERAGVGVPGLLRAGLPGAVWDVEENGVWVRATRRGPADRPVQGWKIHVSAHAGGAEEALRAVLPVLAAGRADFKLVGTAAELDRMNRGELGLTQVGKWLTVYPDDTAEAVRLARELDRATPGRAGPRIPADYPLRRDSAVHYRYGAFKLIPLQLEPGHVVPGLYDSRGRLVVDDRRRHAPVTLDPFEASGAAERDDTALERALARRYHVVARLHWTPRASVHAAVDLERLRQCVVKCVDRRSEGAAERLAHEAAMLRRLRGTGVCPDLYEVLVDGPGGALVMEDAGGRNMEDLLSRRMRLGLLYGDKEIRSVGRRLLALLEHLHQEGIVYRDLKPSNVMTDGSGRLRLIDFELAHDVRDPEPPPAGTRGYLCPHRAAEGGPPEPSDDVYSLGAFLYYAATGANPSHAPEPYDLPKRPVRLLNPRVSESLESLILRCLRADPGSRPSLAEVGRLLRCAPTRIEPFTPEPRHDALETAHALADAMCEDAHPAGAGLTWTSTHPSALGLPHRFLHIGAAGCVLALAEAVARFGAQRHRDVLSGAVEWLRTSAPFPGAVVPGLYVGEAGVGAALLRAGQVLDDATLVEDAARISDAVAGMPTGSPDLMNGRAGMLRFHLLVHQETGDRRHLAHAEAAGRALVSAAVSPAPGTACWRIPEGFGELGGKAHCGYAHGAAGIADSLLDLFLVTGDETFARTASAAARWLTGRARPALPDGDGREWPSAAEGSAGVWCHGAAGVGRFLLNMNRACRMDDLWWPRAAASMVARGARWLGPSYCHGLAGSVDFLLDMYQHTRDREYHRQATAAMRLLDAFETRAGDGRVRWRSDTTGCVTPDYMVGYGGVLVTALRHASADTAAGQLTLDGFRREAPAAGPPHP
ncbi:class III lanthionine synthetase LanKC N-terminal domain-containing protein [Actinomadura luteofluorescens]|uniref:class III lanthionine synthetase LanKC N-terminal domain-containing protein n=1 Tax=Actinomadura luteofluorescens TaxID=46163 RepID=UPI00216482A6|nr:lanthionine synthetase LanC family protein [Actinomadura glauciflava]